MAAFREDLHSSTRNRGAIEGTRTPTPLRVHGPEPCASANSAPHCGHLPKWRNWQTRMVQVHVPARVWGFESLLRHQIALIADRFPQSGHLKLEFRAGVDGLAPASAL